MDLEFYQNQNKIIDRYKSALNCPDRISTEDFLSDLVELSKIALYVLDFTKQRNSDMTYDDFNDFHNTINDMGHEYRCHRHFVMNL